MKLFFRKYWFSLLVALELAAIVWSVHGMIYG